VNISRKKIRHDIITAILDLLRIRYDLTEKVYYHHTKVIADAMLEKVLRSLPSTSETSDFTLEEIENLRFTPQQIYEHYLGDEGFLNMLEERLVSSDKLVRALQVLRKIFTRNLYKAVFTIVRNEPLSRKGKNNLNRCNTAHGRSELESEFVRELSERHNADIQEGDIIVSYPPEKMQKKVAEALIEWSDGQIFTFEHLPMETNYSNEVGILTERYHSLWSMTVYINPEKIRYVRLVESVCENWFDIQNESILKNYLKERYEEYYESHDTMIDINHSVMSIESNKIVSKAAKGGSHLTPEDKIVIVEDSYDEVLSKRKRSRKKNTKASITQANENTTEKLDFEDGKK